MGQHAQRTRERPPRQRETCTKWSRSRTRASTSVRPWLRGPESPRRCAHHGGAQRRSDAQAGGSRGGAPRRRRSGACGGAPEPNSGVLGPGHLWPPGGGARGVEAPRRRQGRREPGRCAGDALRDRGHCRGARCAGLPAWSGASGTYVCMLQRTRARGSAGVGGSMDCTRTSARLRTTPKLVRCVHCAASHPRATCILQAQL